MPPPTLCQKCIFNPAWRLFTQDLSTGYIDFDNLVLSFGTFFGPFHSSDPTDDGSPSQKTQYASSQVFHLGLYGPNMVKENIMRNLTVSFESQLSLFPNYLQMIQ